MSRRAVHPSASVRNRVSISSLLITRLAGVLVKVWFLITLLLTALLLGTSFAHALEMPAKLQYDAMQWTFLQHTLYQEFALIGGPIDVAAIFTSVVLAYLVRADRLSLLLTVAGAGCLMVAFFGSWILVTHPVNAETATWMTVRPIPSNWAHVRDLWEYSHLARFLLQFLGMTLLTSALIVLKEAPVPRRE
jgi:hypothetical protein